MPLALTSRVAMGEPPGRFLSLSGTTYDPGDLHDLEQIFGTSLSPKALQNLIVATKEKEVLFLTCRCCTVCTASMGMMAAFYPWPNSSRSRSYSCRQMSFHSTDGYAKTCALCRRVGCSRC